MGSWRDDIKRESISLFALPDDASVRCRRRARRNWPSRSRSSYSSAMPEGSASNPRPSDRSLLRHRVGWVTLLGCAGIVYPRRPGAFTNPQFWAEDGFFFTDDRVRGFDAIFSQY